MLGKEERLLSFMLIASACSSPSPNIAPQNGASSIELLISSDLRGEVEPCGCNLEPLGGLARLSTALKGIPAAAHKHLILHGNLLSEGHNPSPQAEAQFGLKKEFLASALPKLGLSLAVEGPADRKLPAKLQPGTLGAKTGLKQGKFVQLDGGIVVLREPIQQPLPKAHLRVLISERTLEELRSEASALKEAGIGLILLGGLEGDHALWLQLAEGLFALRSGERGQQLARLELHLRGPGGLQELPGAGQRKKDLERLDQRIETIREARDRLRVRKSNPKVIAARDRQLTAARAARAAKVDEPLPQVPAQGNFILYHPLILDSQMADDPEMAKAIAQHHRKVGDLNRQAENKRMCPPPDTNEAVYLGSSACKNCHPAAYDTWLKTPHSKAWKTLEEAGRNYDYACVKCHSAGFDDAQGFCKVSEAGDRINVGCESCHGPGSKHAKTGDKRLIERDRGLAGCTSCHHPPHTKAFHLDDRLARILGPGHGALTQQGVP
ncbi:MAG TPA: hypothetical protein DEB46_07570 [Myxococcales bacterium]|nr:hypothetical protein [Myxococcales bacterium]